MDTMTVNTVAFGRSLRKEPIHRQLYQILREPIMSGAYGSGSKLPTEAELTRTYNVSRVTVRRALQELAAEGLIEGRKSQGTFVRAGANIRSKHRFVFIHDNATPVTYPYLQQMLQGIQSRAQNLEFRLEVLAVGSGLDRSLDDSLMSDFIESADVHGVIALIEYLNQRDLEKLEKRGIPVVLIGHSYSRKILGPCAAHVCCDSKLGIHMIVDHLKQTGRKAIGFIGKPPTDSKPHQLLIQQVCLECGLQLNPNWYQTSDYGIHPAADACRSLLEKFPELDAIMCTDDLQAVGVIQHLRSMEKRIPQDIAVVGAGNFLEEHSTYEITTTDTRLREQGAYAARCLEDMIAGKHVEQHKILEPLLVRRKTT